MPKIPNLLLSLINQCYWHASKFITWHRLKSFLASELEDLRPESRVLSVGAGGSLGRMIEKYCKANDISLVSLDIDPSRGPDVVGDIATVDLSTYKLDCVFLIEVLEHVKRPYEAVDNIYEHLASPGKVIVSVPFLFPIHERPHDYFRYTKYGLESLFARYDNVDIWVRDSWASAILSIAVRIFFESNIVCKALGLLMIPVILLLSPVALLLDFASKTDFATTGYTLIARKYGYRPAESETQIP